jgi:hypothetical protein
MNRADLMSDSSSSGIEIYTLFFRKFFYLAVLLEVRLALVLYIVVDRHNNLSRVMDIRCPHPKEFQGYWPRVAKSLVYIHQD